MSLRLQTRLILLFSLVLVATFISYGAVTGERQSESLLRIMQQDKGVATAVLAGICAHHLVVQDYAGIEEALLRSTDVPALTRVQVTDEQGTVVGDVRRRSGEVPETVYDSEPLGLPPQSGRRVIMQEDAMVIWEPIVAGRVIGWLKATYSTADIAELRAGIWKNSLLLALLWMVASVLLILLAVRGPVAVIRKISDFAMGLATFKGQQVRVKPTSIEIDRLAASLNYASRDLFDSERQVILERERFEALFTLSQMADKSEREITEYALEEAVRLTRSSVGYLHFISEDEQSIQLHQWSNAVVRECSAVRTAHYPLEQAGVWADSVRFRRPVIHNDYQHLEGRKGYPEGHFPVVRHLSVPVMDGDRIVAVAGVGNKETDYLEDDARRLGLFMADMWKLLRNKRSDAFIKNVLGAIGEGLIVVDREYRIVSANRVFRESFGADREVTGRRCYSVSHASDVPCHEMRNGCGCPVEHTFRTGEPAVVMHHHHDGDSRMTYAEYRSYPLRDESGHVVSAIEVINDATQKMQLEEQLRQSQKMEALGQLTGGVAHDFNNILTAITGFGSILKKNASCDAAMMHCTDQILGASERATALTRSLLAFSRRQVMEFQSMDLNDVVRGVEKFLRRLIGEDIELNVGLSDNPLGVMADRGQIEQVLMNLVANARDAMPDGGLLFIETGTHHIDDASVRSKLFERTGWHAVLSVTDTGAGMNERTRERIFEPFFTTKDPGKGTGLGLSIIYGIIKQHNGQITVYSEPGKGTTFKVYLPLTAPVESREEQPAAEIAAGGNESVLLAEDDAMVRGLLAMILETAGYCVTVTENGEDAVRAFRDRVQDVDLAIMDVVMPRMGGRDAYEEMLRSNPHLPVLFMSGYAGDSIGKMGVLGKGMEFIQKPITPDSLLKKVRDLLDTAARVSRTS